MISDQRIGRHIGQVISKEGELAGEKVNICGTKGICQVSNSTCSKEIIKEMAQRIVQDNLSERDVKGISRTLAKTASDPIVTLLRLSRLQKKLQTLNTSEKIISAILIPEITRSSNKIQKKYNEQRKNEGINFSDHFSLESVKERLDLYNMTNMPNKQVLADIMIMLCIYLLKLKTYAYLMKL